MHQSPVHFNGITVFEPVTVLTDFILCTFCLVFAYRLQKQDNQIWSLFFLSMAIAAFTGGLGHGMYDHQKSNMKMISFVFGIISVFFVSIASAKQIFHENLKKVVIFLICIELVIFLFLIVQYNDIKIVAMNGIIGFLFFVAPIHLSPEIRKNSGSKFILLGICVNAIAGMVHNLMISVHKWFNHNDLSHLIIVIGLYLFAKGAIQFKAAEAPQLVESLSNEVNSTS